MLSVERCQLYRRDYRLVDDADKTEPGNRRETTGVGRYAGWIPVRGTRYAYPFAVVVDERD